MLTSQTKFREALKQRPGTSMTACEVCRTHRRDCETSLRSSVVQDTFRLGATPLLVFRILRRVGIYSGASSGQKWTLQVLGHLLNAVSSSHWSDAPPSVPNKLAHWSVGLHFILKGIVTVSSLGGPWYFAGSCVWTWRAAVFEEQGTKRSISGPIWDLACS